MNRRISILSWIVFLSLGLCTTEALYSQGSSKETARKERELSREIARKEKELETLRAEIQAYEKRYRESEKKENGCLMSERRYGSFRRQLTLPADVDPETIAAKFKHGVLKLDMKKDQQAASRTKKIKIG